MKAGQAESDATPVDQGKCMESSIAANRGKAEQKAIKSAHKDSDFLYRNIP